jgi:threonine dehydratase
LEAVEPPTLAEIRQTRERLHDLVVETPVWRWAGDEVDAVMGPGTEVLLKLELFQRTGTFKPRGALTNMLDLEPDALERGVTAVSAGNHAIAVAYAARILGTTAKVVMLSSANPARVDRCRSLGAEVELVPDGARGFERIREIEAEEGRAFVHPFEGPLTARGTATLGLELSDQVPDLDAVIVPIGGGGLCAGVAAAVKQAQPGCELFGVEPEGADTMHRSFATGQPESIDAVRTIADSLGAPHAAPYSFGLCRRFLDDLVMVDDDALCRGMARMFAGAKLAVEPAGAAAAAALFGPLRERLAGKRVALIVCGTNIDIDTFAEQVRVGTASLEAE